ncbi:MAG: sugar transferase [Deltaproteobacteria bacterium]|nr:sugar transferase [Deltaproteobacteria bacterium]
MSRLDAKALRRIHLGTDVLLVSLGWFAAYGLRDALTPVLDKPLNSFESYSIALPGVVIPWILSCWVFGIYRSARMSTLIDHLQDLFKGVFLGLIAISAIGFFFKELDFGRLVVLFTAAINLMLQGASRIAFYRIGRRLHRSGQADVRALILGSGVGGIRLLQKLQDHPEIGYRVVGFLDEEQSDEEKREVANRPVLGCIDDLRRVTVEHEIEEVFVAMPSMGHSRMLAMVLDCEDLGLVFRVVTNLFEVLTAGTPVELVDDLPLVRLGRDRVAPVYAPVKRVLDLLGASLALAVSAPLLLACALRIRLESPGAAIFCQTRIGEAGRPFTMYKLRTMPADAAPYAKAPVANDDPRVTPFGLWLRRTSIDELPQLVNVIKGNMSLVGPRPEMPFIVDEYDEWQRRRLSVKPGVTGLWQILGRKDLPMQENLQYDFYYIRNRSLLLDLSILVRTFGVVLTKKGAF